MTYLFHLDMIVIAVIGIEVVMMYLRWLGRPSMS